MNDPRRRTSVNGPREEISFILTGGEEEEEAGQVGIMVSEGFGETDWKSI